jgi:hypothetical protein
MQGRPRFHGFYGLVQESRAPTIRMPIIARLLIGIGDDADRSNPQA